MLIFRRVSVYFRSVPSSAYYMLLPTNGMPTLVFTGSIHDGAHIIFNYCVAFRKSFVMKGSHYKMMKIVLLYNVSRPGYCRGLSVFHSQGEIRLYCFAPTPKVFLMKKLKPDSDREELCSV